MAAGARSTARPAPFHGRRSAVAAAPVGIPVDLKPFGEVRRVHSAACQAARAGAEGVGRSGRSSTTVVPEARLVYVVGGRGRPGASMGGAPLGGTRVGSGALIMGGRRMLVAGRLAGRRRGALILVLALENAEAHVGPILRAEADTPHVEGEDVVFVGRGGGRAMGRRARAAEGRREEPGRRGGNVNGDHGGLIAWIFIGRTAVDVGAGVVVVDNAVGTEAGRDGGGVWGMGGDGFARGGGRRDGCPTDHGGHAGELFARRVGVGRPVQEERRRHGVGEGRVGVSHPLKAGQGRRGRGRAARRGLEGRRVRRAHEILAQVEHLEELGDVLIIGMD